MKDTTHIVNSMRTFPRGIPEWQGDTTTQLQ